MTELGIFLALLQSPAVILDGMLGFLGLLWKVKIVKRAVSWSFCYCVVHEAEWFDTATKVEFTIFLQLPTASAFA